MQNFDAVEAFRSLLSYEPETGQMFWRKTGKLAGFQHKDGYWRVKVKDKSYLAHRLAWIIVTGEWPRADIDHINLVRSDNRWANLREATRSQKRANTKAQRRSATGLKGVTWHTQNKRWLAQIMVNRKRKCLGLYDTPEQAHAAYALAAKEHFGEFARAA